MVAGRDDTERGWDAGTGGGRTRSSSSRGRGRCRPTWDPKSTVQSSTRYLSTGGNRGDTCELRRPDVLRPVLPDSPAGSWRLVWEEVTSFSEFVVLGNETQELSGGGPGGVLGCYGRSIAS